MVLPKLTLFSFVLLPYRVGDDLQNVHYGFGARAVQAGAFLLLGKLAKCLKSWNQNEA